MTLEPVVGTVRVRADLTFIDNAFTFARTFLAWVGFGLLVSHALGLR